MAKTRKCLQALEAVRSEANFEVIVIDNASDDDSATMVEREFPWVRLIRSPENLGFVRGHNRCLAVRKAADALLLNSDAYVHPGAIAKLIEFKERHPEGGIFGPKLLNPDGSLQYSCRRFPNPLAALFRNSLLGRLFPNHPLLKSYLLKDWDHSSERTVDWISGAALLATGEFIDKAGPLDDRFFMYCEDVDWCWQSWANELQVWYVPDAIVTHEIGSSSSMATIRSIIWFHQSMFRFYRKNSLSRLSVVWRLPLLAFAFLALGLRAGALITRTYLSRLFRKTGLKR